MPRAGRQHDELRVHGEAPPRAAEVVDEAPPELREIVFRELESAERHELTEEEEATVAKRLADLGYL